MAFCPCTQNPMRPQKKRKILVSWQKTYRRLTVQKGGIKQGWIRQIVLKSDQNDEADGP